MKWCVYWQPDDVETSFFKTEAEARAFVAKLIAENEALGEDGESLPFWDITLMEIRGEVEEVPFDGSLALRSK
jgi:hypothetical protein